MTAYVPTLNEFLTDTIRDYRRASDRCVTEAAAETNTATAAALIGRAGAYTEMCRLLEYGLETYQGRRAYHKAAKGAK